MIDFVRKVNSKNKFSLKKEFTFIEFNDVSAEHIEKHESVPDLLEIWAAVKVSYDGEIPESYKTLNLIIGDWVNDNIKALTTEIHKNLKDHIKTSYPESAFDDLEQTEDSAIWTDQLDYMPLIDENDKSFTIEIELVLDTEPTGE